MDEIDHGGIEIERAFGSGWNLRLVYEAERAGACLFHVSTRIGGEDLMIIFVRYVRIFIYTFDIDIAKYGMVEFLV